MKILAASRLRASKENSLRLIKDKLAIDGEVIQSSNESIMFRFYVRPDQHYINKLIKALGPYSKGSSSTDDIYTWKTLSSIGLNLFLSKDPNKASRIQLYNRLETAVKAYDNRWSQKVEKDNKTKYGNQQKPAVLDDHIFKMQPSAMAQSLKNLHKDDFKAAMSSISFYMNRAGKSLLSPDRDRLDKGKEALRKLYKKDIPTKPNNQPLKPIGAK